MTSRTLGRVAAAISAAFGPLARVGWPVPAALTIAVAVYDLSLARNHLLGVSGDDAYYLVLAQALATGHGLVVLSLPWTPPETSVPPGFPLLLAPRTSNPFFDDYKIAHTPSHCFINPEGKVQASGLPVVRSGEWKALTEVWDKDEAYALNERG